MNFGFSADDYFSYMLFKEYLGWAVIAGSIIFLIVLFAVVYIKETIKERAQIKIIY